jgi:hypothetical protein
MQKSLQEAIDANDKEQIGFWDKRQLVKKINLNSLYGATALSSFRYGNRTLSKSITLSGQRIIQESALCANKHMNKVMKGEIELNLNQKSKPNKEERTNDPKIERNISPRPYGI